jgi:hypothetical protein
VFEKALYHPTVRPRLTCIYSRLWRHPRRVRLLTPGDLDVLLAYFLTHSVALKGLRDLDDVKRILAPASQTSGKTRVLEHPDDDIAAEPSKSNRRATFRAIPS